MFKEEKKEPVENFHRFDRLKHSSAMPKAFTAKGLYMLATILKSKQATMTTLMISETFLKFKHTINKKKRTEGPEDMECADQVYAFLKELERFEYDLSCLDRIWNLYFPDRSGRWNHLQVTKYKNTFFLI